MTKSLIPTATRSGEMVGFNHALIEIIDTDTGERYVTLTELAAALEYSDPERLRTLIRRNKRAMAGKTTPVMLKGVEGNIEKVRKVTLISYHGVIRLSMLSDAPKAFEFQEWAETVLFEVMTKGYYVDPRADYAIIERLSPALTAITERLGALETRLAQSLMAAPQDISDWPTATQRLHELRILLPVGFNRGGNFDLYFANEHHREHSCYPPLRNRRFLGKRGEFVIERCPDSDDLLRRVFRKYLRNEWPTKQRRLKLIAPPGVRGLR